MPLNEYAGRYAQIAGGGMRSSPYQGRPGPKVRGDVGFQVGRFQDFAREGVLGYGAMLGEDFRKNVGNILGDINAIGGLRSGAVTAGLDELMSTYGRQVGSYAAMATRDAIDAGQREADLEIERDARARAGKRSKRSGLLRGVGTLLGAGIGLWAGGPAGAAAGPKLMSGGGSSSYYG